MAALIERASGDDVVVPVLLRRSSFDALTKDPEGASVRLRDAVIGLVSQPHGGHDGGPVWALVVWTNEPPPPGAVPANEESARYLEGREA